jgi:tripartite-type tricarboxylate transporter receptor subunit TctC
MRAILAVLSFQESALMSVHRNISWFKSVLRGLTLLCALGGWACVHAQTPWPQKTVRLVVGFPGGSTPDVAARILADGLSKLWGQAVVVEAKVGAGGNLATDLVSKANDDHTLGVVINGNLTSAKLLNPKLPYDPVKDVLPVSLLATAPLLMVSPNDLPAGTAWVQAVRAAGDKLSYGSVGIGSVGHLGMEAIKSAIGSPGAVHVPYSGNPAIITAMLGGQVQMALMPPGLALPHVKAGKLQAVGLAGPRSPLAPDVPSLSEAGVRMGPLEVWVALVAPAQLSKPAQERLAHDVSALLKDPDVRQRWLAGGWDPVGSSSAVLAARVREETRLFGDIITARGIKLE